MIVIVGQPILAIDAANEPRLIGLGAAIAAGAVGAGAPVQFVGKLGDDPAGDAAVLALGRIGIGHAAMVRDAARPTPVWRPEADQAVGDAADGDARDAEDSLDGDGWLDEAASIEPRDPAAWPQLDVADVELALRYLPDVSVVVVVEPGPGVVAVVSVEAAAASAHVVAVLGPDPGDIDLDRLPPDALVIGAPQGEDPASFAMFVGRYAALVDGGMAPARAFETTLAGQSAERTRA